MPAPPPQRDPNEINPWAVSGLGMELAGAVIGMGLLGWGVDYFFGTEPWGLTIGAVVGLLGGGYNFVKRARALQRRAIAGMNPSRFRKIDEDEVEAAGDGGSATETDDGPALREGGLLEERKRHSMMDRMFGSASSDLADDGEVRWPEGFEDTPDLPEEERL